MKNEPKLSKLKKYYLYERPKRIARKKLKKIDAEIQDEMLNQLMTYADRKTRGLKVKPIAIPKSLINKYEAVLIEMVKRYRKNGRTIAQLRKKANT